MTTRRRFCATIAGALLFGWRTALAERARAAAGFPHPEPRPGVTGEHVLPEAELGTRRRVIEAYNAARIYPEIFDGVFCACYCDKSMKHRSLLSCFESRQAIGCRACREQAEFVVRHVREGRTLAEIRAAVDREYAS